MRRKSLIILTSIAFSTIVILSFPDVNAEVISVTVDLQTILLEPSQIIPLLDTKSVGNMSKVQISATLPCESNNTPKLKIFAGALGKLVSVVDSSSDYKNLRGPFNTCYYEDTISPSPSLPVLNKVFLNNTGSSSIVTNLGSIITLTGFINGTSGGSSASQPTYVTDFTECTTNQCNGQWASSDTTKVYVDTVNDNISFNLSADGTNDSIIHDLGFVADDKWVLRFKLALTSLTPPPSSNYHIGMGIFDNNHNVGSNTAQDFIGMLVDQTPSTKTYYAYDLNNGAFGSGAATTIRSANTETIWVQVIRNNTSVVISQYSDSTYSGGSELASVSRTLSGPTNLEFIGLKNYVASVSSLNWQGTLDDVKFWNGVTIVP